MKHLFIGIWFTGNGEWQTHPTNNDYDADQASYHVTRHANRFDIPDAASDGEWNMICNLIGWKKIREALA